MKKNSILLLTNPLCPFNPQQNLGSRTISVGPIYPLTRILFSFLHVQVEFQFQILQDDL